MRIRIMSDFHFTLRGENGGADPFFKQYLERYFHEGPEADLYVSLGDLTQDGKEEEYRGVFAIIDSLGKRDLFRHVPGNHDLLSGSVQQTEQWAKTPQIEQGFGSIETEQALLLFANTSQEMKPLDWGGRFDPTRIAWLKKRLGAAQGKPVLVFAHHPLPHTTALSDKELLRVEQPEQLVEAMSEASGTCFWFNGHNHIQSIVRQNQWTYVQCASVVCLPSWSDVVIDDGVLRLECKLPDEALQSGAERVLGQYGSFHRVEPSVAAGTESDQVFEIAIS
ncbi:metallophosphoesterase family protein [Paenibacillus thalictri]|uniref:Calcineurin-like phosphoesterase domain-containing protein n=1 Tax=Paenibacillus thalictri TaxID=2527873 RepID=A0A4Q9DFY2_9BACL|nr:metallophosphoesterase [Paenibacillus thalictri]TBL69835.1 hypothetical protein EYB31_35295 [Paenibacillus thalictri]